MIKFIGLMMRMMQPGGLLSILTLRIDLLFPYQLNSQMTELKDQDMCFRGSFCPRCANPIIPAEQGPYHEESNTCEVCDVLHCSQCTKKYIQTICGGCHAAHYTTTQKCLCYAGHGGPGGMRICDLCWPEFDRKTPPNGAASSYCRRSEVRATYEHNVTVWRARTGLDTVLKEPDYTQYKE